MTYEFVIRADGSPALVDASRLADRQSPPRLRVDDAPGRHDDDHDDDQEESR